MFPTNINGTVELPSLGLQDIDSLLAGIERELDAVVAKDVVREGNVISFRGGFFRSFFISRWNLLVPIRNGTIEVVPGPVLRVDYRLSTVEFVTMVSTLVIVAALLATVSTVFMFGSVTFLVFAWFCFIGVNYLIAMLRFPFFVKRAARRRNLATRHEPSRNRSASDSERPDSW
ncbi:MAG: hypothetical protein HGA39_09150 [Coriobacteriia bacterium]|nr:hypothetical protein [Coriobacteriia bacterium]